MNINIISDIHLEFLNDKQINQLLAKVKRMKNSNVIGLLGDIGRPYDTNYKQFLNEMLNIYEHVLLISGNHELYSDHHIFSEIHDMIDSICKELNSSNQSGHMIYYLNRRSVQINDCVYIGCTLWSEITKPGLISYHMSDYQCIHVTETETVNPKLTNSWHQSDLNYLISELKNLKDDTKAVILTHHAPLTDSLIHPYSFRRSPYREAFCTDLSYLFSNQIIGWFYGHTHQPYHSHHGSILIASNPMDYDLIYLAECDDYFAPFKSKLNKC